MHESNPKKVRIACEICKKEMVRYKVHVKNHIFCSYKCKNVAMPGRGKTRVDPIICDHCRKGYYFTEIRWGMANYCSKKCMKDEIMTKSGSREPHKPRFNDLE